MEHLFRCLQQHLDQLNQGQSLNAAAAVPQGGRKIGSALPPLTTSATAPTAAAATATTLHAHSNPHIVGGGAANAPQSLMSQPAPPYTEAVSEPAGAFADNFVTTTAANSAQPHLTQRMAAAPPTAWPQQGPGNGSRPQSEEFVSSRVSNHPSLNPHAAGGGPPPPPPRAVKSPPQPPPSSTS